MQKIIKLGVLLLMMSKVNATMMPEKYKNKDKVLKIHGYEREVSKEISREITDIVKEEVGAGNCVIDKVWNKQQERFFARSNERYKEMDNCLLGIGFKKVLEASKRRQKECEVELLYWKDIRAKRLAREIKSRGNSNSNYELARKQIVKVEKEQEYIPRQKGKDNNFNYKLVLNWMDIKNILRMDDLVTFEKVAWKNKGMTKDEMLRQACIYGSLRIAFYLIQAGANVNYIDKGSKTLLHWAVITQNIKVAKLLIQAGANVNQKDCFGKIPLYNVLETGDIRLAKLLIKKGADINSKDDNIRTILEYGLWRNNIPSSSAKDKKRRLKVMNYIRSVVEEKKRLNRAGIIGAGEDLDIYPV